MAAQQEPRTIPAAEDRWLRTAEAAAYLGRQPSTLRWWRAKGLGPEFSGRYSGVRYRLSALDAFMRAETRTSTR